MAESRADGDKIASRTMFEKSERLHLVRKEERIGDERLKTFATLLSN